MLLLFPQGQLGNQIFQYQFAKLILKKGEKILTSHSPYFSIIDESENKYFKFVPGKQIWKYVNFGCYKICEILARLRVISSVRCNRTPYKGYLVTDKGYYVTKGVFSKIRFINGFFVYEDAHLKQDLKIISSFLDNAKVFLSQIPSNLKRIFIHVRRGDYLTWGVMGQVGTALPVSYYNSSIDYFVEKYDDVAFIFLSDDIKRCKEHFGKLKHSYFSNKDVGTDFAIMTLCDGGIISASTFSFIGGYYCKGDLEKIGPKYFYGFKNHIQYPRGIDTNKFIWIDVKC